MEVTQVRVYLKEKEGSKLKAFVDFTLDECLAIKGAKIIEGKSRVFVSMPGKINKYGKEENVVFPTKYWIGLLWYKYFSNKKLNLLYK